MEVSAEAIEEMNLLGLFMKAALEERLPALERARPSGTFAIESGGMSVTLSCSPRQVIVRKGLHCKPDAKLSGELDALAQLASGRVLTPVLSGRIRIAGNLVKLLPLARVFR